MRVVFALSLCAAVLCGAHAATNLHHMPMVRSSPPSAKSANALLTAKAQHWGELLSKPSDATHNLPLVGNVYPLGIYGINMAIGSPLQPVQVAVDSGSCTLVVVGEGCKGCNESVPKFNPSKSSTCVPEHCPKGPSACAPAICLASDRCHFENSYQTCNLQHPDLPCTISGPVWEDVFSYGGDFTGRVPFGTITYQTPGFEQLEVIDGINGFACKTTFFGHPTPFLTLAQEGKIEAKVSFCFGYGKDKTGFEGGVLTLGGFDPKFAKSAQEFTPLIENELYVVNMSGVSVNGKSIGAPWTDFATGGWGGTVLDSGTNILLMPSKPFDLLFKFMQSNYCGKGKANPKGLCGPKESTFFGGACFPMTEQEIAAYPPIELAMQGMAHPLVVPPHSYILSGATNKTSDPYCFGVKDTGNGGFSIIGDTVMSGYVMELDRVNNRVGWAAADRQACSETAKKLLD